MFAGTDRRGKRSVGKGWGSGMTKIRWKEGVRVAVAAFAVAAMGVETAAAADMIRKPAPGPAGPVINWTGCYVGATMGWGLGNLWRSTGLNLYTAATGNGANINPWEFSLNSSALGGGTAGCNWQANRWFVLGVEGEGGYLSLSQPALQGPAFNNVTNSSKIGDTYGAVNGRFGIVFFDQIYWYGKVGVAFLHDTTTITDQTNLPFRASASSSQSPLAVGSGVEYAFNEH
jgi:outer membrane immunogenic protein